MWGKSQVRFETSQWARIVDQLVNGAAHESKVGYTTLTKSIRKQIAKDIELMSKEEIKSSIWHFYKSPVIGKGGASQPLLNELQNKGIKVVNH